MYFTFDTRECHIRYPWIPCFSKNLHMLGLLSTLYLHICLFVYFTFDTQECHIWYPWIPCFSKIKHMLGLFIFTFTFTLESEEFEKFEKVGLRCWVCNRPWSTLELLTELTNQIILRYLDNYGCWTKTLKGAFLFAIKLLVSNKIKALIYSKMNIVHL